MLITELFYLAHYIWEISRSTPGVLHDIANPLTTATSALETVLRDAEPGLQYKATSLRDLAVSLECLHHIEAVLKQQHTALDLPHSKPISFSLRQEIQTVKQIYKAKFQAKKIRLQLQVPPHLRLRGNSVRFRQVVGNLLSNAIDASDEPSLSQPILIHAHEQQHWVTLIIHDQGTGIPSRVLKQVFQPFFTTKGRLGTGLGLSIVKDIVEHEFGGRVQVQSRPKLGTTFTLKFPKKTMI